MESCVLNNGMSTGYFTLVRGTRQGDPLAPYLFLLVIEILATMVRDNVKIEGLTIRGVLVKQCLFAHDSIYFLKDVNAFKELVKTIEILLNFSSLKVNYQKSEAAWLGTEKYSKEMPHKCQWVSLTKETVKILDVHFTYNKDLLQKLNLSRVNNNFNTVLNLWKNRNLTIYGHTEVAKTLALSKLLYFTNFIIPTEKYIDEVKSAFTNFIGNGRKPKIKYTALISNINQILNHLN